MEDPYWCCGPFPRETNTRTCTHSFTHREANSRQWQAVAILSPAPSWDQEGFWRQYGVCGPSALALLLPRRRNQTCNACGTQFLHMQTAQHRKPAFHVGRKIAVRPLTPLLVRRTVKGHGKNWMILDWPYFFTAQLVHNMFIGQTHAQWL